MEAEGEGWHSSSIPVSNVLKRDWLEDGANDDPPLSIKESVEKINNILMDIKSSSRNSKAKGVASSNQQSKQATNMKPIEDVQEMCEIETISEDSNAMVAQEAKAKLVSDRFSKLLERIDFKDFGKADRVYFNKIEDLSDEIDRQLASLDLSKYEEILGTICVTAAQIETKEAKNKAILAKLGGEKLSRLEKVVMKFAEAKTKTELQFFPLMTLKEMELVDEVWSHKGNMDEEVIIHEHILEKLTFRNLATLKDESWLNDEVINAYIRLINNSLQVSDPRKAVMNTYFFDELLKKKVDKSKLLRILSKRKIDLGRLEQLFLPYNQNNLHWCFYCLDFRDSTITYFDSLKSHDVSHEEQLLSFANMLFEQRSNQSVIQTPFRKVKKASEFPSQGNGYDCGVFLLKGIDCLSRGNKVLFDQYDLEYLRYLISFELISGKFLLIN
jgi:hypothetical protein